MKKGRSVFVVAAIILCLAGCVSVEQQRADFKTAVDQAGLIYSKAMNAGDVDLWLSVHDAEAMKMPQDAPSIVGIEAIGADLRGALNNISFKDFKIMNQEYEVFGDLGYARGLYSMTICIQANGAQIPFEGKFLTVYRKQEDGSWKIYRDSYSSNTAAQ